MTTKHRVLTSLMAVVVVVGFTTAAVAQSTTTTIRATTTTTIRGTTTTTIAGATTTTSSTATSTTSTTTSTLPRVLRCQNQAARFAEQLGRQVLACETRGKLRASRGKPFDLEACRNGRRKRYDRRMRGLLGDRCGMRAKVREAKGKPLSPEELAKCRVKQTLRCPTCLLETIDKVLDRTGAFAVFGPLIVCEEEPSRCPSRLLNAVAGDGGLMRNLVTCRVAAAKEKFRDDPDGASAPTPDELKKCYDDTENEFSMALDLTKCPCQQRGVTRLKKETRTFAEDNNRDSYCSCRYGSGTCDDMNPCTSETCLPKSGNCNVRHEARPCTDDGDPCTADNCVAGECEHTPQEEAPCPDEGNPCTADVFKCRERTCTHLPKANGTECADDGDMCTADACRNGLCVHSGRANGASCSDGDVCNGTETCRNGVCEAGKKLECPFDGKFCTDDCDRVEGCKFVNNSKFCEDGDACTQGDRCGGGECQPGTPIACEDDNPCTNHTCSATIGCVQTPIAGCTTPPPP